MAVPVSRTEQWAGFDPTTRERLIESSLDEIDRRFDRIEARMSRIMWLLVTAVVSTSTATVLLAMNLVAAGHP